MLVRCFSVGSSSYQVLGRAQKPPFLDDFPLEPPFVGDFPLPCLIVEGYTKASGLRFCKFRAILEPVHKLSKRQSIVPVGFIRRTFHLRFTHMRLLDFGKRVFSSSPENLLVGGLTNPRHIQHLNQSSQVSSKKERHILNPPTSLSSGKKHVDGFVVWKIYLSSMLRCPIALDEITSQWIGCVGKWCRKPYFFQQKKGYIHIYIYIYINIVYPFTYIHMHIYMHSVHIILLVLQCISSYPTPLCPQCSPIPCGFALGSCYM